MSNKQFWYFMFFLATFLTIAKIYQHNLVIHLTYEKQKFDRKKNERLKEKNRLLLQLQKIKNQENVVSSAQKKLGLKPINLSQIITVS